MRQFGDSFECLGLELKIFSIEKIDFLYKRVQIDKFLPFLSNFSQEMKPFESSYCKPKYQVSRNPIVLHTNSKRSLPVARH